MAERSIISRQAIQHRGATAFKQGKARNDHGMNDGSAAIADFHIGYDAAAKIKNTPASLARVELAQGQR